MGSYIRKALKGDSFYRFFLTNRQSVSIFLPTVKRGMILRDADALSANACLFVCGEEGLLCCRDLSVDAVVSAVPAG